ncbi:hypothetical protein ACFOG5_15070 [Pedobacter fastidiosus]|uniref:hypothetical protein n=1 Tax=Pedobacter fastidiosus TaxID=2765361 RepID=UPI00361E44B2
MQSPFDRSGEIFAIMFKGFSVPRCSSRNDGNGKDRLNRPFDRSGGIFAITFKGFSVTLRSDRSDGNEM